MEEKDYVIPVTGRLIKLIASILINKLGDKELERVNSELNDLMKVVNRNTENASNNEELCSCAAISVFICELKNHVLEVCEKRNIFKDEKLKIEVNACKIDGIKFLIKNFIMATQDAFTESINQEVNKRLNEPKEIDVAPIIIMKPKGSC